MSKREFAYKGKTYKSVRDCHSDYPDMTYDQLRRKLNATVRKPNRTYSHLQQNYAIANKLLRRKNDTQ